MNGLGKLAKGVSLVLAGSVLMASSTPVLEAGVKVRSEADEVVENPLSEDDIYFSDDCTNCRYVIVYDENANLVMDKLVRDKTDIRNQKIIKLIKESDFLMSNSIADYYILSK